MPRVGKAAIILGAILGCFGQVSVTLAGTVNAGNGWKCTANNIQNASYNGGSSAYIHLRPYNKGKRYAVRLNSNKTRATGTTTNGTSFVCTK